jgi:hypothetical protein
MKNGTHILHIKGFITILAHLTDKQTQNIGTNSSQLTQDKR